MVAFQHAQDTRSTTTYGTRGTSFPLTGVRMREAWADCQRWGLSIAESSDQRTAFATSQLLRVLPQADPSLGAGRGRIPLLRSGPACSVHNRVSRNAEVGPTKGS
jgi:hypothetical protein